ncbi:Chitin synthase 2 [Dermatophagoides pteronyssinus]|uniref:chitin synthase n=2 Tax=Dermatophagoides pteronyssinus TaxID=6956 RepID=A0ABQ8ISY7_DERPT|nr:Chitin synthase 2 [Dermatophagoides pteronyssinus]
MTNLNDIYDYQRLNGNHLHHPLHQQQQQNFRNNNSNYGAHFHPQQQQQQHRTSHHQHHFANNDDLDNEFISDNDADDNNDDHILNKIIGNGGGGSIHANATQINDIYNRSCIEPTKGWDVFVDTPPEDEDETLSSKWIEKILKFLKLITFLLTFLIVLFTAVFSKSVVLFMTSMIRSNRTVPVCAQGIPGLERDKKYVAVYQPDDPERIAWIWSLFFILVFPEFMTLFRSVRICTFKSYRIPTKSIFFTVFAIETIHTLGMVLLIFIIFPSLDVVKGAMLTNCLCFIPSMLAIFSRREDESKYKTFLDIISMIIQAAAIIMWPIMMQEERIPTPYNPILIPIACIMISLGWWENYLDKNSNFNFIQQMAKIKQKFHRTRYFIYIFISIWKVLLIFISMFASLYYIDGSISFAIFGKFREAFGQHKILIQRDRSDLLEFANTDQFVGVESETFEFNSRSLTSLWLVFMQIIATWLCYVVAKFTCKICIQGFSFAFPISLTVPVTISVLITFCGIHFENRCPLSDFWIPKYLFWFCQEEPFSEFLMKPHAFLWVAWLLSQIWISVHIWNPKCERLATTEKIFVLPMYNSVLIDQSLAMNRRRDDEEVIKSEDINLDNDGTTMQDPSQHYETISDQDDKKKKDKETYSTDQIIRIYAVATMWHETTEEMLQMLKSVMRMDEDQCARRNAQKYLRIIDPDYYEFEVHIFFDDAFELCDENDEDMVVNRFVKQFVQVIDTAASYVHQCNIKLKVPKKYPTPYGGRLEWLMPGQNKLIAHLKDKMKIRHRKRWSQVMYMYYLLGHKIMELPIDVNRKAMIAENTYLLTLDGDINFRPHAVQLLVDLMKKNKNLGAACGRIHPVGTGFMYWYQKFEYAIGHWLQKATEHMIGCVLCSPGCFSLFRAKALMDDNVMRKYTTKSEEALHYVQYDQGEDRWLCTLLLQRGYRVEYSAASDAYTHCPEGFGEFYTQRRRWAPSTMANIMDLLCDYKRTVKVNDNISLPYIIYQGMLMVGTILGPGTIFLMLVGAVNAVFRISNWDSFIWNFIPILMFIIVCFLAKNEAQIFVAQILSAAYCLLMMAVFVGQAIQMTEDGLGSPSAIFFLSLTGSFIVAGLLHPQEISCLGPLLLYFLSIPCMYLLLILYSLINLNVVTWGTREVQSKKTKKELEEERKAQEEIKKKSLLGFLNMTNENQEEGSITFNLANLCKCMLFTYPKPNEEAIHLMKIQDQLEDINKKVNQMGKTIEHQHKHHHGHGKASSHHGQHHRGLNTVNECFTDEEEAAAATSLLDDIVKHESNSHHKEDDCKSSMDSGSNSLKLDDDDDDRMIELRNERDESLNPYWIEDKDLKNGEVAYLHPAEIQFWRDLIDKYLLPIEQNKDHQARVAADLKELRNRVFFGFFMLNALFVLSVFLLQLNKEILHVDWPLGVRENITINPDTNEFIVEKEYLELEPIGLVFVIFFGSILIIQFVGMLFHRFATLSHILASVELSWCSPKIEDMSEDAFIDKNAIQIVRHLQRLRGIDEDDKSSEESPYGNRVEKRKTIYNLEKRMKKPRTIGTLDVAFRKRFLNISNNINEDTPILGGIRSKEHFLALQRRKNTLIANDDNDQAIVSNNNSGMQTLGAKNEFTRNTRQRSTLDTKRPSKGPAPNPPPNQYGIPNPSFNGNESDNDNDNSIDDAHATTMNLSIYGANNTNINNTRNHRRTTNFRQKNRNSDLNSEL